LRLNGARGAGIAFVGAAEDAASLRFVKVSGKYRNQQAQKIDGGFIRGMMPA
jgi:hypothetical protein